MVLFTGWGALKQLFDRSALQAMLRNSRQWDRDDRWEREWGQSARRLHELLTPEEWEAAANSLLNAHYTSRPVVEAMWSMAEQLGFHGGKVLEPAAGIGHFFGFAPQHLVGQIHAHSVEMDTMSAAIVKALYPIGEHIHSPLEQAKLKPNSVDLAITNVPFLEGTVHDSRTRFGVPLNTHNYFIARMIEAVRPGGLVITITTSHTMDSQARQREFLASRADLVAAYRLPNTAFAQNAGTEAQTDILILRKPDATAFRGEPWSMTALVPTHRSTAEKPEHVSINEYFSAHPEHLLGRVSLEGTMHAEPSFALLPDEARPFIPTLLKLASELRPVLSDKQAAQGGSIVEAGPQKYGALRVEGGELVAEADDGKTVPAQRAYPSLRTPKLVAMAKSWVGVRDAYMDLLRLMQSDGATDAEIAVGQERLGKVYDAHRATYGPLGAVKHRAMEEVPDYYRVGGLEVEVRTVNPQTKRYEMEYRKADVFTRRTVAPIRPPSTAANITDAINISVGFKGGLIDPEMVAGLLSITPEQAAAQLADGDLAYLDPESGLWRPKQVYLSGNVRRKLDAAERALATDPSFQRNVDALRPIQPAPWAIENITFRLGSSWLPQDVVQQWVRTALRQPSNRAKVEYIREIDRWIVHTDTFAPTAETLSTWGTSVLAAHEFLEDVLNGRTTEVRRRVEGPDGTRHFVPDPVATKEVQLKAQKMNDAFVAWVRSNQLGAADAVAGTYNERFNFFVTPDWDGSPLTLPGSDPMAGIRPYPYQLDAVMQGLTSNSLMAAIATGGGKTYVLAAIGMELKRLARANKPVIAVMKPTFRQFADNVSRMYPNARLLVPSERDFEPKNRRRFLARIASGDYDLVILTHEHLNAIPSSPKTLQAMMDDQTQELMAAIKLRGKKDKADVRAMQKQLKRNRERLASMIDKLTAHQEKSEFTWEDLGIDALLVDEAHAFKRPPATTKRDKVKGIATDFSQRALALLLKTKDVQRKQKGGGVFLATATPISNTLGEAYAMMRFTHPQVLAEYGIETLDQFIDVFAKIEPMLDQNAGGKWVRRDTITKFVNGDELNSMLSAGWYRLSDSQLIERLGEQAIGVPKVKGGGPQSIPVEQTPTQQRFIEMRSRIFDRWEKLTGDEKRDNQAIPVLLYMAARAAALDGRLVFPDAAEEPGGKIDAAAAKILDAYRATGEHKGVQLVFSDTLNPINTSMLRSFAAGEFGAVEAESDQDAEGESGPTADSVRRPKVTRDAWVFRQLADKLVKGGIPEDEIVVFYSDMTEAERELAIRQLNDGDKRIGMGSTATLGTGVNVQKRAYAAWFLDVTWRGTDMIQRIGRVVRQGNLWSAVGSGEVEVGAFIGMGSGEGGVWSKVVRKATNFEQVMGGHIAREFDDPAGDFLPSMRQMMVDAIGDPRAQEIVEIEDRLRDLRISADAYARDQSQKAYRLRDTQRQVQALEDTLIPAYERRVTALEGAKLDGDRSYTVNGQAVAGREQAVSALQAAMDAALQAQMALGTENKNDRLIAAATVNGVEVEFHAGITYDVTAASTAGDSLFSVPSQIEGKVRLYRWHNPHTMVFVTPPGSSRQLAYDGSGATPAGVLDSAGRALGWQQGELAARRAELVRRKDDLRELEKASSPSPALAQIADLERRRDALKEDLERSGKGSAVDEARRAADGSDEGAVDPSPALVPSDPFTAIISGLTRLFLPPSIRRVRDTGPPPPQDEEPPHRAAPNEEVARRMRQAHGASKRTILQRLTDAATAAYRKTTRTYEHLPNVYGGHQDVAREILRSARDIEDVAKIEESENVAAIIAPLTTEEFKDFELILFLRSQLDAAEHGEPLRQGLTSTDEVQEWLDRVVRGTSSRVMQAIERRTEVNRELVRDLVRTGLLQPEALDRVDAYWHGQVRMYQQAQLMGEASPRAGRPSHRLEIVRAAYRSKRVTGVETLEEQYDLNTSYIEAEVSWRVDAQQDLMRKRLQTQLDQMDISPRLKREAREANLKAFYGDNYAEIVALQEALANAVGDGEAEESNVRELRQQLQKIDPLYAVRAKIRRAATSLLAMIRSGRAPESPYGALGEWDESEWEWSDWNDLVTHDGQWWKTLAYYAGTHADTPAGILSLTVFRGIADRDKMLRDTLGDKLVHWTDLVPEEYAVHQHTPGNVLYEATTIPEKLAERLMSEPGMIPDHAVKRAWVMGGPRKQVAIPADVSKQLSAMPKPMSGPIAKAWASLHGVWKIWVRFIPTRAISAILREGAGTAQALVIAHQAGAFKHVPAAHKMLKAMWRGKVDLDPMLRLARREGILYADQVFQDTADIASMRVFDEILAQGTKPGVTPKDIALLGWRIAKLGATVAHRANQVIALAMFLRSYERMRAGVELGANDYGGARPETLRVIREKLGPARAAAHLTNQTMGDYRDLTALGEFMRRYFMPFYAWMEVNSRRIVRVGMNVGRGIYRDPLSMRPYLALGSFLSTYAAMWAWNNLVWGHKEDQLSMSERALPHLNVCWTATGDVRIFRNPDIMGDFLSLLGTNAALSTIPLAVEGQVPWSMVAGEAATQAFNRWINSLGPAYKLAVGVTRGETWFPDFFRPSPTTAGESVGELVGMRDEFKWLRGWVTGSGERGRPGFVDRLASSTVNPEEQAMGDMHALLDKWRRATREESATRIMGVSSIADMRNALKAQDFDNFRRARDTYLSRPGKGWDTFKRALDAMDPVARLSAEDEAAFREWLTPRQRDRLVIATAYAARLKREMTVWWFAASADDDEGRIQRNQVQTDADIARQLDALTAPRPIRLSQRAEWESSTAASREWLRSTGIPTDDMLAALRRHSARKSKDGNRLMSEERYRRIKAAAARRLGE